MENTKDAIQELTKPLTPEERRDAELNHNKRRYGQGEKKVRHMKMQRDFRKKRFYGGKRYWYVIYAIDMHNVKQSGFLQEKAEKTYIEPMLTTFVSKAKKLPLTEEGAYDFILRLKAQTNPRLFLVPLKLDEIKSYQEFANELYYEDKAVRKRLKRDGKIEYF